MNIKYRILSIDKNEQSCIVRFFTDLITEESLSTSLNDQGKPILTEQGFPVRCRTDYNLTIWNDEWTKEEIISYIESSAPRQWFELQEKALNKKVNNSLDKLQIGEVFEIKPPPPPSPLPSSNMTDEQIYDMVKQLIK